MSMVLTDSQVANIRNTLNAIHLQLHDKGMHVTHVFTLKRLFGYDSSLEIPVSDVDMIELLLGSAELGNMTPETALRLIRKVVNAGQPPK